VLITYSEFVNPSFEGKFKFNIYEDHMSFTLYNTDTDDNIVGVMGSLSISESGTVNIGIFGKLTDNKHERYLSFSSPQEFFKALATLKGDKEDVSGENQ
jgi:hypothetical protein